MAPGKLSNPAKNSRETITYSKRGNRLIGGCNALQVLSVGTVSLSIISNFNAAAIGVIAAASTLTYLAGTGVKAVTWRKEIESANDAKAKSEHERRNKDVPDPKFHQPYDGMRVSDTEKPKFFLSALNPLRHCAPR